jgi:hypothetical protein
MTNQPTDVELTAALLGTALGELITNRAKLAEQMQQQIKQIQTGQQHLDKFDAMIALLQVANSSPDIIESAATQAGANYAAATVTPEKAASPQPELSGNISGGPASDSASASGNSVAAAAPDADEAPTSDAASAAPAVS